jgi:hypothetical protein
VIGTATTSRPTTMIETQREMLSNCVSAGSLCEGAERNDCSAGNDPVGSASPLEPGWLEDCGSRDMADPRKSQ